MTAPPRFSTPRNPDRPTTGARVNGAARALGRTLFDHQRLIADVSGEVLEDGTPAYPETVVVMPRRGGKTGLVLAVLLERMKRRPDVRAFYTAQGSEDATKVLRDEWAPIIQQSPLRHAVGFRFARGDAGMFVRIGGRTYSRTEIFTPNATALHGRDADLAVCDEVWAHTAARGADIDAGIRPARWARPDSQLWYVSAGGTTASGWLHQLMDRGRAGAPGMAYFEWSADAEAPDYDPYDPRLWEAVHPGIGNTTTTAQIAQDAGAMTRAMFERSVLCVWDRGVGSALLAGWEDTLDAGAAPIAPLVLAVDVHPDRAWSAIAMAGGGAVELVEHRPGTGWLEGRLAELVGRHRPAAVVRDAAGPAAATRLEDIGGAQLIDATGDQVAEACAWLVDAIAAEPSTVAIRPHAALRASFAGARTRQRGDGVQLWVRRSNDADLTPLYAITLAGWAAATVPVGAIY